jgi:hypothetical protein
MKETRIKFKQGKQREFIEEVKTNLNSPTLKNLIFYNPNLSYSALKNYYREKNLMSLSIIKEFCELSRIRFESLNITYLSPSWGQVKGGKKGIQTTTKRYPKKIKVWRLLGMSNVKRNTKEIKNPPLEEGLAELIGVYLGDGTLTKYFMSITGDYRYDLFYFNYLSNLIYKLFGIYPTIRREKLTNSVYLIIFSKNFCSFFKDKYNLPYGNKIKNKSKIPIEIIRNKNLSVACLRGLIDTDGCVSRRGRNGSQFCLQFTSHNKDLLNQVDSIGKELKIFTYRTGNNVGTNKWSNIIKYFNLVGSSNPKHIIRFLLKKDCNKAIYLREFPTFFKKPLYRNISLPYKMDPWSSG